MRKRIEIYYVEDFTYVYYIIIIFLLSGSIYRYEISIDGEVVGLTEINKFFFLEFRMWVWVRGEGLVLFIGIDIVVLVFVY